MTEVTTIRHRVKGACVFIRLSMYGIVIEYGIVTEYGIITEYGIVIFRYVTCCAFSSNNQYLASGSNDKTVMIWKLSTEDELISMYISRNLLCMLGNFLCFC